MLGHTLSWPDSLIPSEEFETHQRWRRELGKRISLNLGCLKELDVDIGLSVFLRISPCQGKPPGFVEQSFHFIRKKVDPNSGTGRITAGVVTIVTGSRLVDAELH